MAGTKKMIDYEYTNKNITPWGGLRLIAEFYERCGLRDAIRALPLPEPGSNRGYHPGELIDGFLTSVLLGARRFSHSGVKQAPHLDAKESALS